LQGHVVFETLRLMEHSTFTTGRGIVALPDFSGFQRNFKQYQNVPWSFTRCVEVV